MGCVSSKIMTRSGSFQEWKQSMQKRSNGFEESHTPKNGGDQFLALLYTANTVARRLKEETLPAEHEPSISLSLGNENSMTIETRETNRRSDPEVGIQTVNTLELLHDIDKDEKVAEDLEDHKKLVESTGEDKFILESNSKLPGNSNSKDIDKIQSSRELYSRSIHTVEEFDALVAKNHIVDQVKKMPETACSIELDDNRHKEENRIHIHIASIEQNDSISESTDTKANAKETTTLIHYSFREKGWRRKAMAKELGSLKLPSFEFAKSASLREWLKQGGQVSSPGSYITPKFGNFYPSNQKDGADEYTIFDPDLVAIFEKEMQQLTADEEYILRQI